MLSFRHGQPRGVDGEAAHDTLFVILVALCDRFRLNFSVQSIQTMWSMHVRMWTRGAGGLHDTGHTGLARYKCFADEAASSG